MGCATNEYQPSLACFRIGLVYLHGNLGLGVRDTGTQVLFCEEGPVGGENDRSVKDLVLGRQCHRPVPAVVNQAPDSCGAEQLHALSLIQPLHYAASTSSRARRSRDSGRTEIGFEHDRVPFAWLDRT